jgi:hypothetical protein
MAGLLERKKCNYFSKHFVPPLAAGVLFLFSGCAGNGPKTSPDEIKRLRFENEQLSHETLVLRARTEDLIRSRTGLSPDEKEAFIKKGLKNPQEDIINDLGSREELMPFKGIFGARPSFYKDVRMYILNSRWVYATWDNGNSIGQRLFEFSVSDDGKISWKVIDTYLKK